MPTNKKHVLVCVQNRPLGHPSGSCQAKSSASVYEAFVDEFNKRSIWAQFRLTHTGCLGPCAYGPSVVVYPEGTAYGHVTVADVRAIIENHLLADQPVARLTVDGW